jgi:flagellar biosynthetic protein FlhB
MAQEDSDDQDEDSKTEEPSQKKLQEALERGQVINSKEVTSFFMIFGSGLFLIWILPFSVKKFITSLKLLIENSGQIDINLKQMAFIMNLSAKNALAFLGPLLFIVVILPIFSSFAQQGQFVFSPSQITPKLSRISLQSGLARLFSFKSFLEMLKGLLKISIIGFFIYLIIKSDIKALTLYQDLSVTQILDKIGNITKHVLIFIIIVMAAIAGLDYGYQRYEYFKSLKMSKYELKQEFKNTEGNPQIKQKIRSTQVGRAKRRMMANVPKADVIITNPTHYAIALSYDPLKAQAPIVTAKGVDFIAQEIKKIATKHDIPTVENKPLAHALYKVPLDEQIPKEHYEAVAKIINYVYQRKNKQP